MGPFDYFLTVMIALCICVFLFGLIVMEVMQEYPDLWRFAR
jgi:hypothetical protein